MAAAPWVGIKWSALGFLALLIALAWSLVAERQFRLWLYAAHYVPAELEVTQFTSKPRNSSACGWIDGILHPGGEQVTARDRDVSVRQFEGPDDRWGHEPRPGELEGQRLAVMHWPRNGRAQRWWHPASIVGRGSLPRGTVVTSNILVVGALAIMALFCFRRGFRNLTASATPEPRSTDEPGGRKADGHP